MDAVTVRWTAAGRAALAALLGVTIATTGAVPGAGPAGATADAGGADRCRAPQGYTIVEIEPIGTGFSEAVDINDRGVVVGLRETPGGVSAYVWRRGRTVDITPPGSQDVSVGGINDRGEVVHSWFDPVAGEGRVAIWRNGRSTVIGTGYGPRRINERGEALFTGPVDGRYVDLLWTGGQLVQLPRYIEAGELFAQVIGDGGHVAGGVLPPRPPGGGHPSPGSGFLWEDGTVTHAVPPFNVMFRQVVDVDPEGRILFDANGSPAALWDRGVTVDLGTLGGGTLSPGDMNDRGQIVGNSTTATGDLHAFLWDDGRITDLAPIPGTTSYAYAVNERGEAIGMQGGRGVVWACGRTVELPGSFGSPVDINDRGQVLGPTSVATPTRR